MRKIFWFFLLVFLIFSMIGLSVAQTPLIIEATLGMGGMIVLEAGLSFLWLVYKLQLRAGVLWYKRDLHI